jgi:hypothetical protein
MEWRRSAGFRICRARQIRVSSIGPRRAGPCLCFVAEARRQKYMRTNLNGLLNSPLLFSPPKKDFFYIFYSFCKIIRSFRKLSYLTTKRRGFDHFNTIFGLRRPAAVAHGVCRTPRRLDLPPWRTANRLQPPWATVASLPARWARGC